MPRLLNVVLATLLWGGMFALALGIASLDLGYWPQICGPWGCLAALAPLLSVHCMWLVLLAGVSTLARSWLPSLRRTFPWLIAAATGFVVLLAIWGIELGHYLNHGGEFSSGMDPVRFVLFHTMQMTDFPVVEFTIISFAQVLAPTRSPVQSTAVYREEPTP